MARRSVDSMLINILVVLATGAVMILINRHFNLLRTTSVFFAAYFMLTMACIPAVMGQFTASSILGLLIMGSVWLLFSVYNTGPSNRRIFLAFFLLGLGQLVEYTFVLYIPVFIAGLGQMRIFRFKKSSRLSSATSRLHGSYGGLILPRSPKYRNLSSLLRPCCCRLLKTGLFLRRWHLL